MLGDVRKVMKTLIIALCLMAPGLVAQKPKSPLMEKDLPDVPGKEGVMSIVEYAPGQVGSVHRHNADVFVYVLQGTIIMQVRGKPAETLHAGQTFYESPTDIHQVGKNASSTESAKFIVVLIKQKGAPTSIPVDK
jgi:quercetin dioxygenase-like cupin family protein